MKFDRVTYSFFALLLFSCLLHSGVNSSEIASSLDDPVYHMIMTQVTMSESPNQFVGEMSELIHDITKQYERELKDKKKRIREVELNCSLVNASLIKRNKIYQQMHYSIEIEKKHSIPLDDIQKHIRNLTLELISINETRYEYEYQYDKNNEIFRPLLNLTQLVTENLNCVDKYLRKLLSKSLPENKIPLGAYEKQRIHEKKRKCFRKLEIFSLEIAKNFDNKNLNFSNNLNIIMNLYHLAKGSYPKMITQIQTLNNTINHLFGYYSKINNFYSNGTTVISYYSASIHNKKSLLNNFQNSHLMHMKELSENLDDLSTDIQKTININEDTAETYARYCVNTISSLKHDIRRE
jgi:hypothetical protein